MKTLKLLTNEHEYVIVFDRTGDISTLEIDGEDRSQDGNAIDAALKAFEDHGIDIQEKLSAETDIEYWKDEFRLAKGQVELDLERKGS